MKKTLLATSLAVAMGVAPMADAAFTTMGAGDYTMSITGGCFNFGPCSPTGTGAFTDNNTAQATYTTTASTVTTRAVGSTVGSGSVGGTNGTINFTVDNSGNMTISSYAQDSYLGTAGGTFFVDAGGTSGVSLMTGNIDGAGNVLFTPTGREGLAGGLITTLGVQPWNDSPNFAGFDSFSTGTTTNVAQGTTSSFSVTGTVLTNEGVNGWKGTLASTGNINGAYWSGFDNIQYSEIFNVSIVLNSADPVANDDVIGGGVNTPRIINIANELLINDTHADQTLTISFVSATQPTPNSTLVNNMDGTLTYTPDSSLGAGVGVDSFTYTITESGASPVTDTATVSITLAAGSPPVGMDDSIAATEDTAVTFNPVLGGGFAGVVDDTDADSGQTATLFIASFDAFSANSGTVSIAAGTNNLTYTPAANFNGADTFNYVVEDSTGLQDLTTEVTVTVAAVNDAPVCTDVGLTAEIDKTLSIDSATDLLSTTSSPPLCTDVEGDALSLATFETTGSNGGTLESDGAGTLTYTPVTGFAGNETFSYTATDGETPAVANTLTINVASPLASNFTMLEKAGNVFGGTNDVVFEWDEVTVNTNDNNGSGVPTDVNFGVMTIASSYPFFNFTWQAHHVRVFRNNTLVPIEYKFDVTCTAADYDAGNVDCNKPLGDQDAAQQYLIMTLQPGEIGGHILFDWNTSKDIDVINVWKENEPWNTYGATEPKNKLWLGAAGIAPAPTTDWRLVSSDVAGDGVVGINGSKMIDGPFRGYFANFNYKPGTAGVSLPPYDGQVSDVDTDAFSMEIWSLLAGLFSVFGLRRINNKK